MNTRPLLSLRLIFSTIIAVEIPFVSLAIIVSSLIGLSGSFAFGQATPNKQAPVIGKSAGSGPEETLQLNPFEVQADKDDSYGALNSNSITRFKTDLDKMPISADIYDQTFMRDVAAQTVEAMIQTYSSGSGYSGADAGAAAASSTPGDRYLKLRAVVR